MDGDELSTRILTKEQKKKKEKKRNDVFHTKNRQTILI